MINSIFQWDIAASMPLEIFVWQTELGGLRVQELIEKWTPFFLSIIKLLVMVFLLWSLGIINLLNFSEKYFAYRIHLNTSWIRVTMVGSLEQSFCSRRLKI